MPETHPTINLPSPSYPPFPRLDPPIPQEERMAENSSRIPMSDPNPTKHLPHLLGPIITPNLEPVLHQTVPEDQPD